MVETTKEIGNRIRGSIDSTEKVIRLETNMQKAIDKFKTSYIEHKKYIEGDLVKWKILYCKTLNINGSKLAI